MFRMPLRVYLEDTDAGGIVYHSNYLNYMERTRTEFMRELGYHKAAMLEGGQLLVVHSLDLRYLSPAYFDEMLEVTARLEKLARSYVVFLQQVWRDKELLCEANIKVACIHPDTKKPTAFPKGLHQDLTNYLKENHYGV